MKRIRKNILAILTIIMSVLLLFVLSIFIWISYLFPTRTIQVLYSPDLGSKAVLKRTDGIDLNFTVIVNGRKVYSSPDFAPDSSIDFRERIVWDRSGNVIILEVAGKRLFGYNVKIQRSLSDSELLSIEYAPEPEEWEYGFEGEWPEDLLQKKNN